jgi:hypothetical protein
VPASFSIAIDIEKWWIGRKFGKFSRQPATRRSRIPQPAE